MTEPISLDTAKLQCRVLDDDEDDLIETYITAARRYVENITSSILVQREIVEQRDEFGDYLELYYRPIVTDSVEIEYIDADGSPQDYVDFFAQTSRSPARIYATDDWPTLFEHGGVTVTYTAGYEEGEEPPELLQAMLLLIGHWYANREAVNIGDIPAEVQLAVESLCAQHWRPVA
jgi:uncharacterized phiE125 gp8 family phage protein